MQPKVVLVTGASGQIGYAINFMIAQGRLLGDTPIELRLLELEFAMPALQGVVMELEDIASPLITKIVATSDVKTAFEGVDVALLIGARPRSVGMERKDLLKANAEIFTVQGKALNDYANPDVKVLVVGNPANTNALIAMKNAPKIPRSNFTAMTRLDQNRAFSAIARRANVGVADVKNVIIWGNHSSTQYPDVNHATVKGQAVRSVIQDDAFLNDEFIKNVQQRGAAIIAARKLSSAGSAAAAACDHVRCWLLGTKEGEYVSMGVISDNNTYGIPEELIYSFPCTCKDGKFEIVQGLSIDEFSRGKLTETANELLSERQDALGY